MKLEVLSVSKCKESHISFIDDAIWKIQAELQARIEREKELYLLYGRSMRTTISHYPLPPNQIFYSNRLPTTINKTPIILKHG